MWSEELKNGKFKFRERYTNPLTDEIKTISITIEKNTVQTRKLAQITLSKRIDDILSRLDTPDKEYTLSELVDAYRADQKTSVKVSTYKRNYFACDSIIKLLGGNVFVNRLTGKYVTDKYRASGKAAGTLNESLKRFKALIRWGFKNDMVSDTSFLNKIQYFKADPHRVDIIDKYLEGDELSAVITDMRNERWALLTRFLALSGLRFAEFCALENSDIDFLAKEIHITKGYDSVNKLITTTKNDSSYGNVHIQPELKDVCRSINNYMLRYKFAYGINNKLFMCERDGDYTDYYAYNKYLKFHSMKITKKIITPHALRHTHASLLFEQGFSIDEVARRLRHGDSKITRQIYVHVTKKLKEKDDSKLDSVKIL